MAEHARPELVAHSEAHHHLLRSACDLLKVVAGTSRDLVENDLFRGAATKSHCHLVEQLCAACEELVLCRHRNCVTKCLSAADHRDLVHWVCELKVVTDDRVAHLVVGGNEFFLLAHHSSLLLGAGDHAHDPLFKLDLSDLLLAGTSSKQRRLVYEIRQVRTGKARGLTSEGVCVDFFSQRLAACVDGENLGAALAVRAINHDLAVKAAWAKQRRVKNVGPVGGRDQDDVVLHFEAVHLDQQLVERLLALVVTAAHAGTTVTADRVDFVHEDDARAVLLGLFEQVTDPACADADEHLDKVIA